MEIQRHRLGGQRCLGQSQGQCNMGKTASLFWDMGCRAGWGEGGSAHTCRTLACCGFFFRAGGPFLAGQVVDEPDCPTHTPQDSVHTHALYCAHTPDLMLPTRVRHQSAPGCDHLTPRCRLRRQCIASTVSKPPRNPEGTRQREHLNPKLGMSTKQQRVRRQAR